MAKPKESEKSLKTESSSVAKTTTSSVDNIFAQLVGQHNKITPGISTSGDKMESEIKFYIDSGSLLCNMTLSNRPDGGWPSGRIVEVFGKESIGKAQPLSSKILTPDGWKKMRDMEPGMIITAADGTDTTVIKTFPQGLQDVYEITFDDKTKTRCTKEHLWYVNTRGTDLGQILTLEEILEKGLKTKHGHRNFNIPLNDSIIYNPLVDKLPINPYLLGLLLGDGCLRQNTIEYATADQELLDKIQEIITNEHPDIIINSKGNYNYTFTKKIKSNSVTSLSFALKELGLVGCGSYEKFIPEMYLFASVEDRIELLRGLMDTNGYASKSFYISYTTVSPILSNQFIELVRGLGFRCTISSKIQKYHNSRGDEMFGKCAYTHSLLLNNDIIPFHLTRKKNRVKTEFSNHNSKFIESISLVGKEECKCILVSHPDQLYITDDYIVTHNSTLGYVAMANCQKMGGISIYGDVERAGNKKFMSMLGVNLQELVITNEDTIEKLFQGIEDNLKYLIAEKIRRDKPVMIVVDSVTALQTDAEEAGGYEYNMNIQMKKAMMLGKALKKIIPYLNKANACLFLVNQIRDNTTGYGDKYVVPGGKSIPFYASIRLYLEGQEKILAKDAAVENEFQEAMAIWKKNKIGEKPVRAKLDEVSIGSEVTCYTKKNKTAPPFRTAHFRIIFNKGLFDIECFFMYCVKYGFIKQSGAWNQFVHPEILKVIAPIEIPKFYATSWLEILNKYPQVYAKIEELLIDKLTIPIDIDNSDFSIDKEEISDEDEYEIEIPKNLLISSHEED